MGDKLRNTIAIAENQTNGEIDSYRQTHSLELGSVYLMADIPVERPADRAKYLDLKLKIKDDGEEEGAILTVAKRFGKASALKDLEAIAIKRFF